jgi:hypothetical protein
VAQDPRSTSTAVVVARSTPATESQRDSLATVDLDALYRSAVLSIKGQAPFGGVNVDSLADKAEALANANEKTYVVTFYLAAKLYRPEGDPSARLTARIDAIRYLGDRANVSPSNARLACDMVDVAATFTINEDTGLPTLAQLNRVARANIKKAGGAGIVNGWAMTKFGRWDKISDEALADKCLKIWNDDRDVNREQKALRTPEDPHEPPDVEVVGAEPVRPAPRPLNTPEQQEAARRARAADLFKTLAVDGSRMLAAMADFDPTHPWVQENSSDWRRAVEAVDQVKALIDDATKLRAV